jgi:hypothetical protein
VTTSERLPRPVEVGRSQGCRKGSILADWLSSTDHKIIGHRYLITSSGFFLAGGIMAMIMRAQLMGPGQPHRVGCHSRSSIPTFIRSRSILPDNQGGTHKGVLCHANLIETKTRRLGRRRPRR